MKNALHDKNKRLMWAVLGVVLAMGSLSYASVPLYRLFCQVTGYDGTTQRGTVAPHHVLKRSIRVSFDAQVDPRLPWRFAPEKKAITVKIGQQGFINFHAANKAGGANAGTALFNVTPEKAGKYFVKTQCFCFARQSLDAGKTADFPVVFYVDPKIADDPALDDVTDITLSYTFYRAESPELESAMENTGTGK
jgi:cytochrome c oxidase assembly protein subunit 11